MFKWLERWFENELIGVAKTIKYICLLTIINCAWVFGIFALLDYLGVMPPRIEEATPIHLQNLPFLIVTLFYYAFLEESIFRFFPISVIPMENMLIRGFLIVIFTHILLIIFPVIALSRILIISLAGPFVVLAIFLRDRLKFTLAIIFMSSVFFAFAHGPSWWHILFQGVGGIIFSVCYLKCGGYNNGRIFKPILASTSVHCLSNVILIMSGAFFSKF